MSKQQIEKKLELHYEGSSFWLIFWLILFFPLGLVLLLTQTSFSTNKTSYGFKYKGRFLWLYFWTLMFFPIALVLLFLHGCFMMKADQF